MSLFVRKNVTAWGTTSLVSLALLATSCAGQDDNTSAGKESSPASARAHGYVEGAQEAASDRAETE